MSQFALNPTNPLSGAWQDVMGKVFANRDTPSRGSAARSASTLNPDEGITTNHEVALSVDTSINTPAESATTASGQSDIAISDWDVLLCAVKARLRHSVNEPFATPLEPHLHDHAARVKSCVLECVDALDQLHQTLAEEFDRQRQIGMSHAAACLAGSPESDRSTRHQPFGLDDVICRTAVWGAD